MYKESIYNIEIAKINNKVLLHNGAYGKLAWFDDETYSLFRDKNNIVYSDRIKEIVDNGFIVKEDLDEFGKLMSMRNEMLFNSSPDKLTFTIAPTSFCNMNCIYCFEKGIVKLTMNKETCQDVVHFIEVMLSKNKECEKLHITWYGGEPLLGQDSIDIISKKIINTCKDKEIKYTSSIITNGLLLTKEVARHLKSSCQITSAQVSIDGFGESYSKLKNTNIESLYKVINNIKAASEFLYIDVRINVSKSNCLDVIPLFVELFGDNPKNITAYLAIVREYNNISDSVYNEIEYEKLKRSLLIEIIEKGYIDRLHLGLNLGLLPCSNLFQQYALIGPDGNLYTCSNHLCRPNYVVGNVRDGFNYNKIFQYFKNNELNNECSTCKLFPYCSGQCPDGRLNGNKCDKEAVFYKFQTQVLLRLVEERILTIEQVKKVSN